jgi:hypothetical protein
VKASQYEVLLVPKLLSYSSKLFCLQRFSQHLRHPCVVNIITTYSSTAMPRRQPLTCVWQSYSRDVKLLVLHQSYVLGNSSTVTAINLNMDVRVVQRVKQTFKATGEVCKVQKGIGRPPLLTIAAIEVNVQFYSVFSHLYSIPAYDWSPGTLSRPIP